jgi:hypothetical protein
MVTRLRSCLRAIENKALQHPTHPDLTPQKSPARSPHPDDSVATQCTCVEHRCHPGFVPFPRSRPSNDPDDGASCHVPEVRRQHHGRAGFGPKAAAGEPAGAPEAGPGCGIALSHDSRTGEAGAADPGPISCPSRCPDDHREAAAGAAGAVAEAAGPAKVECWQP